MRFSLLLLLSFFLSAFTFNFDKFSEADQKKVDRILGQWAMFMEAKKEDGSATQIDFPLIYSPISEEEKKFLDEMRTIDPKKEFDFQGGKLDTALTCGELAEVPAQWIEKEGEKKRVDQQYLPLPTLQAYERMMEAMQKDLGKKLVVESGYRSPAYQLYTFLFYLPKHGYSIRETAKWIAFPGYSEHGSPVTQAIDFMNEKGINGEDDVTEFERLPEYEWLVKRAGEFRFELSYPRGKKGINFEPWHWRHIETTCSEKSS